MKRAAIALAVALLCAAPGASVAEDGKQKIGGAGKAGDDAARRYFTDTELVDQHGKMRRFYTDLIRGRKLLINFGFTSCKGVCPAMAANLAKVQKLLGARAAEVTILTITVDPVNDTPAALKRFAESVNAGPSWVFLTGTPDNVGAVLQRLGGAARRPEEHSAVLIVGDAATGTWLKTSAVDNPASIVTLLDHINDKR